jgi:hypothetical protein
MSRRNKSSDDEDGRSEVSPDDLCAPTFDLYDYGLPPLSSRPDRCGSGAGDDLRDWIVTDDWPEHIPVSEAEVDLFERWFGDFFDELFGDKQ